MRLTLSALTLGLILASTLPTAAHADTIDDFTLTGSGHTITYSLPATSSFPGFSLFNFFQENASATVDGVSGYGVSALHYLPGSIPVSLILSVPNSVFGAPALYLRGAPFFSYVTVPASNPFPYLPYDVVPTFIPGTYTLQSLASFGLQPFDPPVYYTLTINPESTPAPVPEPSSLALLATGTLAVFSRRKFLST